MNECPAKKISYDYPAKNYSNYLSIYGSILLSSSRIAILKLSPLIITNDEVHKTDDLKG